MLRKPHRAAIAAVCILAAVLAALLLAFAGGSGGTQAGKAAVLAKAGEGGDADSAGDTPGLGPVSFDAYQAAERTYPANVIPPAIAQRAENTFNAIAAADAKKGDPKGAGQTWQPYGPVQNATQPGVLAFSGATNNTASRVTALVADPNCTAKLCRLWAGVSGGGVWRTDDAIAPNPDWQQVSPMQLDQNSVGTLTLDPSDPTHNTLYLGTGEANRCSSGCEAGVGIYKSTDGGSHWTKLADACVNNATYSCAIPGNDAFLGRGINSIVIDPSNRSHIFVGSALGVRGLNHVIGAAGETQRFEPGANEPGLYESTNGGATFTEVWNGAKPDNGISFGITDSGLDPLNPAVVYVAGFDAGVWRRDAGAAQTNFQQVFAPQFDQNLTDGAQKLNAGIDRSMFALTVKNNKTRIYLTDGTAAGGGPTDPFAANFWRTDNANNLTAAALLASQGSVTPLGSACNPPDPGTHTFPASYNTGWQCLTSRDTANPYFPTQDFCWAQCWYDENVYTPAGMPDTVYVIGAMQYDELPCDTKGVGCGGGHDKAGQGAGMSNGRAVLYSNTAGDPDSASGMRTFTDLTTDKQNTAAPWCAFEPFGLTFCRRAANSIHPDQHAIVINPGDPTQIFEGSDGGVIRTSGTFADISSHCDEVGRDGVTGGPVLGSDNAGCKRLLSRVPVELAHINTNLSSTIQLINAAIDPFNPCRVLGGTQDNGTWANPNSCGTKTFTQVIYGDGGNAVFDSAHPNWMANEFIRGAGDVSFENGDPQSWVVATAPITRSGEGPSFYWPQVGDPNPVPGTHPIYEGAKHVWRSWAFNGGHTTASGPQNTSPDIPFMESHCPEFVVASTNVNCGDARPLGGPMCDDRASTPLPLCVGESGDLTASGDQYGTDRAGGTVSWIARDSADHGTMWVATSAGRIFVTHNADAADPSNVTFLRIDRSATDLVPANSPTRFPSSIYVDPANVNHAWISYSGYNAVTPTTPGHVFSVTNTGATGAGTFTNLNVELGSSAFPTPTNDGDLPVADVVRDDATHTLYVATDFGVVRGDNDGASWHVTDGMPRYEVMHLAIEPSSREPTCKGNGPCPRVLYAATHSQGIWKLNLGS